nr:cytochrome c oxidase assembly protein [Methylomarinum sp. Ch1-1]MDP4520193.1 cytochrome c oxidase assembly protein [Methylomarinum sp. Ch1-1]
MALLLMDSALAHGLVEDLEESRIPLILGGLLPVVLWLIYAVGAWRVPPTRGRWLAFHAASLAAALTMFGAFGGWSANSSAIHMIEHMLIMVFIAPFYVMARPLPQWRAISGRTSIWLCMPLLRLSRYPLRAACLQSGAIWFWHTPKLYNLVLARPWWHLVEHVCLALIAGIFWWSILHRRSALALLALLLTLMATGMLGAVLTFAHMPLFDDSSSLQDQQLAGLIMWAPAGLPYLLAGAWCGRRLLSSKYAPSSIKWE